MHKTLPTHFPGTAGVGLALLLAGLASPPARAQSPDPAAPSAQEAPAATAPRNIDDPYQAYQAGAYEQALQSFVDRQVERPDDPALALNVGTVHYQMKNYAEAEKAFAAAATAGDEALRAKALYNLGNSAFRQGRLEEAVQLYKATLEIDPDDEDAKYNLEFVRNEIRRRHEEAKKRQEDQQQNPQGQDQQQDPQEGGEGQGQEQGGQDSDGDGLPDEVERSAENPTDPGNPDTDQDGLKDGQEDRNGNGRVDEGETDPNKADSDGDGIPDAEDPQPSAAQEGKAPEPEGEEEDRPQGAQGQAGEPGELSEEEAERYLQALEEGRPDQQRGRPSRGRSQPAKDW